MLLATELWEHFCCVGVDKVNAECFSMSVMLQKWKGQLHFWLWSSLSQIFHVPVQTSKTLHLMQRMFTLKKKKRNFSFFFFFGFFPVLLRSCHFEVKKVSVRRRGLGFFFFFAFALPCNQIPPGSWLEALGQLGLFLDKRCLRRVF